MADETIKSMDDAPEPTFSWLNVDILLQDRIRFLASTITDKSDYNQRFDELLWILVHLRVMAGKI